VLNYHLIFHVVEQPVRAKKDYVTFLNRERRRLRRLGAATPLQIKFLNRPDFLIYSPMHMCIARTQPQIYLKFYATYNNVSRGQKEITTFFC